MADNGDDENPREKETDTDCEKVQDNEKETDNENSSKSENENMESKKQSNITASRREPTSVKIGKRSATLYLSSHSLKTGNGNKKTQGHMLNNKQNSTLSSTKSSAASKRTSPSPLQKQPSSSSLKKTTRKKSKNKEIPDEMLQLKVQKEFTFTGYDIMADVEPKEEIDEEDLFGHTIRETYRESCKLLGVTPVSCISRQLTNPIVSLRSVSIGPKGAKAVAITLVKNSCVKSLDLEDTGVESEGAEAIAEMLEVNKNIVDVNIAENLIGKEGLRAITEMMKENKTIESLDLTGSGFVDADAYAISEILLNNKTLKELLLSHNNFGSKGAYILATAIAQNDTLRILDLSWNHIRGEGAQAIGASLQKNIGLRKLDISWNGFNAKDCMILGCTIKENTTLKELDISNNQLGEGAIGYLMKGIQSSDGLEILRISGNLIVPKLALIILKTIECSESCRIHTLDLSDVEIDEEFLSVVDDIQGRKPFFVAHGPVIKRYDSKKGGQDGIDGNLDGVVELFKYMQDNNYRVIDLMKWLDKDGSMSVSRDEFKKGMITAEVPLTEHQLDKLLDRLDADGDGEVDFKELLQGERMYRRKMRAKQERLRATKAKVAKLQSVVLATIKEKP